MSDFDDPVVRDQLQRLAGHYPDEDLAYASVMQGVRVAKRRRAVLGASALGTVLVVALGSAALVNRDTQRISPAASNDNDDPAINESSTTPSTETSTSASTSTSVDDSSTSSSAPENSAPTVAPDPSIVVPSSPSVPAGTGSAPATSTVTATGTGFYETKGGSITVVIQDGRLLITNHTVAPGFEMRIDKAEADRIRVRFIGDGRDSRIEVELVDGVQKSELRDDVRSPDNTFEFPDGEDSDDNQADDGDDRGSGTRHEERRGDDDDRRDEGDRPGGADHDSDGDSDNSGPG